MGALGEPSLDLRRGCGRRVLGGWDRWATATTTRCECELLDRVSWSWLELQRAEHAKMFTVAKSAGFDILGDVADAVDRAQAQGQTLAQFQADLEPLLRKKGW